MRRFLGLALSAILLTSACKIERTPPELIRHRDPAEVEIELARAELRDRVTALGRALDRGDLNGALLALSPAADAYLVGPEGSTTVGAEGAAAVLRELVGEGAPTVHVQEVYVTLGPRARIGWFAARMEMERPDTAGVETTAVRMTGVYVRTRGEWRLVQGHLSRPATLPSVPQDSLPPDSLAREDE